MTAAAMGNPFKNAILFSIFRFAIRGDHAPRPKFYLRPCGTKQTTVPFTKQYLP
jgi:hypothetical protein